MSSHIYIPSLIPDKFGDLNTLIDFTKDSLAVHGDSDWENKRQANYSLTGLMKSGMGWRSDDRQPTQKYTEAMVAIRDLLLSYANANGLDFGTMNYCLANLYKDGDSNMGWHVDGTRQGVIETNPIVSVSFGDSRIMEWQTRDTSDEEGLVVDSVLLESGDVFVISDEFQKLYEHRIPPMKDKGARINLTFRSY